MMAPMPPSSSSSSSRTAGGNKPVTTGARKYVSTWRRRMPRPSLMWMSINDVMCVRNAIIGLYLAPGQELKIAPPRGMLGHVSIHMSATTPVIEWREGVETGKAWMRYDDKRRPYWDYQHIIGEQVSMGEIMRLPFKHPRVRIQATIVKHFSRYFPFVSTDNYLVNGGKPIA